MKIIIQQYLLGLVLLSNIFLFACVAIDEPDLQTAEDIESYCPTCSEDITWDSYGDWNFTSSSSRIKDGELINDFTFNLRDNCDWSELDGSQEEWEDILNDSNYYLTSPQCRNGVILEWSLGFSAFYLSEGWLGSTPEGIKLGISLVELLNVYPEFEQSSSDAGHYRARIDRRNITAKFDEEKRLKYLIIER